MGLIDNISTFVLVLIRAGAIFRVAFCFFKMITVEEEAPQFRKRIKNVLLFYIIAECVFILKGVILFYYA